MCKIKRLNKREVYENAELPGVMMGECVRLLPLEVVHGKGKKNNYI